MTLLVYNINYAVYSSVTGPPGTPTNITFINIASKSFAVQWEEVDDAEQYFVNWSNANGGSGSETAMSQKSHIIAGLIPNTTYNVTITAWNSCGFGIDSYTISGTTLMDESPVSMLTMMTTATLTMPNSLTMSSYAVITSFTMIPTGNRYCTVHILSIIN